MHVPSEPVVAGRWAPRLSGRPAQPGPQATPPAPTQTPRPPPPSPPPPKPPSRPQTQRALPFIVSCPACRHNFVHLWCLLTCSPDQAAFTNVTAVQLAADNNATAVAEVDMWVEPAFADALYDSCKVGGGGVHGC